MWYNRTRELPKVTRRAKHDHHFGGIVDKIVTTKRDQIGKRVAHQQKIRAAHKNQPERRDETRDKAQNSKFGRRKKESSLWESDNHKNPRLNEHKIAVAKHYGRGKQRQQLRYTKQNHVRKDCTKQKQQKTGGEAKQCNITELSHLHNDGADKMQVERVQIKSEKRLWVTTKQRNTN